MKFCFHLLHLNPYEPPNCKLPNFRPCSSEKSPPTHHHSPQMIPDRCVCSVVYTLSSIYLSKGWHIQPLSQAGGEYKAVGDLCEGHRARSLKDQVEQERSSRILEGKSMGLPEAGWNNEMPAQQGHGLGRPSLCCGTYRTWCTFSTIIELTWTRGARSILSINEWSSNVYISTLIRHIHCDWCTHENFSGWWIWILYIHTRTGAMKSLLDSRNQDLKINAPTGTHHRPTWHFLHSSVLMTPPGQLVTCLAHEGNIIIYCAPFRIFLENRVKLMAPFYLRKINPHPTPIFFS